MHSIKTLKTEIDKLKFVIEHSSSKSLKNYYTAILLNLCDLLYELTDEEEFVKISRRNINFMEKYNYNLNKDIIRQVSCSEYTEMIDILTKRAKKYLKFNDKMYFFTDSINLNNAKDLIKSFICEYDISLYPIIENALDDEHLFLINDKAKNGEGYSFINPYSKTPYISIYVDNDEDKLNIENLICLMHELGHIIHFYTILNKPKNYSRIVIDNFIEVPSTTFELLFIQYLIKNKIDIKNTQMALRNTMIALKEYVQDLRVCNSVVDLISDVQEIEIDDLKGILSYRGIIKTDNEIISIFNNMFPNYHYSYGGLLGFYYLDLYKQDPEKTRKNLYDFTKCIGIMDDAYMLENFGINKQDFINCTYLKKIIEENQKQLKF